MMKLKLRILALALCAAALCRTAALPALAAPPDLSGPASGGDETPADAQPFHETLGPRVIGDGETVDFTTLSPNFADNPYLPENFYPGDLTVELTGQVVIESGGSLSISTLSIGSSEPRPSVTGTLSGEPLIVVKEGGKLTLTCVDVALEGEGVFLVQEAGASVALIDTPLADGLIEWSAPLVCNEWSAPDDVWLEAGTALSAELLPGTMKTAVQSQGKETDQTVALAWDFSAYDGRTSGEWTVSGSFLDEEGEPMLSFAPLELTVHWYEPGQLTVTEAAWKGQDACTAELTVLSLPEFADVWGEVSADGKTWAVWDEFEILAIEGEASPDDGGPAACVFSLPDNTPRYFRVVACDSLETGHWATDAFLLPSEEDGEAEDSGGNRGGSTTPLPPEREPAPAPDPAPQSPADAGEPPAQTPAAPEPVQTPAAPQPERVEMPEPEKEALAGDEPAAPEPEASPEPGAEAEPETEAPPERGEALPLPGQIALAAGAVAVCVLGGMGAARIGPFRRKSS